MSDTHHVLSALEQIRSGDAHLLTFGSQVPIRAQTTTEDLLQLLRTKVGLDEEILRTNPPAIWDAEISSSRLDSHFTRMDPATSLVNYAADAEEGRAFLSGHRHWELPIGRSIRGVLENIRGEAEAKVNGQAKRVLATFYTVSGLTLNGLNTSDMVAGIRSGIISDVSIGFSGGEFICSTCNKDLWTCPHIPGRRYKPPRTKDGDDEDAYYVRPDPNGELCWALVRNAHLSEVSAVYDGSTPGAAILKTYQAAEDGQLTDADVRWAEQHFRMKFPAPTRVFPTASQGDRMSGNTKEEQANLASSPSSTQSVTLDGGAEVRTIQSVESVELGNIKLVLRNAGLKEDLSAIQDLITSHRALQAERDAKRLLEERVAVLEAEVPKLRAQAADGEAYRKDLIEQALIEGVRAHGAEWDQDAYRTVLEASTTPLQAIKRFMDDWSSIANERFPKGRQSVSSDSPAEQEQDTEEQSTSFRRLRRR